jgi:hypothetical protein
MSIIRKLVYKINGAGNMKNTFYIRLTIFLLISVAFTSMVILYSKALPDKDIDGWRFFGKHDDRCISNNEYDSSSVIVKTFPVTPNGTLYINNDFSDIQIESWEKDEVLINIRKEGDERKYKDYNVSFSSSEGRVEVYGRAVKDLFHWGNFSVHFMIKIPKDYNIDCDNSAGDIKITNTKGKTKVNSSAGNITLAGITGDIDIDNSAGNINLSSIDGRIKASESAGNIEAEILNENKGVELETSAGNIHLWVSETMKADLDVSASLGSVDLHTQSGFSGEKDGNDIKGKLNGGGNKIKMRTSLGNIEISGRK